MIAYMIVKLNDLCDSYIREDIENNLSQKTIANAITRMSRINYDIINNLELTYYYCTKMSILSRNLCDTKSII